MATTDPTGWISHEDELHRSQTWKRVVRVATTASDTLSTAFANGQTVDGVTLATGDRILLKDQSTGSQNGIYVVAASGAPVRAFDMDQDGTTAVPGKEIVGAMIPVQEGTANAGTIWRCTNTGTPTLGSTALTFAQFTGGGSSTTLPWSYAKADGGLAGDGTTDDTAALAAWIASVTASGTKSGWFFFEPGTYLLPSNITLPAVSTGSPQITLHFMGAARPPFAVHGGIPTPGGYSILKSTATSGTAVFDGGGTNNISVVVEDLVCLSPSNPAVTFWHLANTQGGAISGLLVSTVTDWVGTRVQPTHSGVYGVTLPGNNNSNYTYVDGLCVYGFYTGVLMGELSICRGLIFALCINAVEVPFANHAGLIIDMQQTWCTYGITGTGAFALDVLQYDSEHTGGGGWPGATVYDLNDPGNHLTGHVRWWGVQSGTGPDHVFNVNGASGMSHEEIGTAPSMSFATPAIVLGTAAAAGSAPTAIRSDSTIVAFDATAPVTQALGDAAATGSAAVAARRDHKHGMPALSTATPLAESGSGSVGTGTKSSREDHVHPAAASTGGELLISDTPSTPLVFADILQNEAQTDFVYSG